jgi:hypothetical protein
MAARWPGKAGRSSISSGMYTGSFNEAPAASPGKVGTPFPDKGSALCASMSPGCFTGERFVIWGDTNPTTP